MKETSSTSPTRRVVIALAVTAMLLPSGSFASLGVPVSPPVVTQDAGRDGAVELAQLGGRDRSDRGAFKPDPIYGGGRGRDPYGPPLEADPYRAGSSPNNIRFAPPNAGLHGPMNGRPRERNRSRSEREEEEAAPRRERRLSPEDNRANRQAQQSGQEAE
jgi:hypothetical protein